MSKKRDYVSNLQLAFIIISTMIGVSILSFARFVAEHTGSGTPFASLTGIIFGFVSLLCIVILGKRFPKNTLIGYNEMVFGSILGKAISCLIILVFLVMFSLETRHYAEAIQGSVLPNTPIQVAIIIMIALCVTTSYQSASTFANLHFFYLPLIIMPIIIIILPAFKDMEYYNLLPILGDQLTFANITAGAIVTLSAIGNFIVIGMVIPFMKEPQQSLKSAMLGYWIAAIIVMFVVVMIIGTLGESEILETIWPTLELGRTIDIPGNLLSRIDAILLTSWIFSVFTTLLSYYFLIVRGICELLRFHHYRVVAIICAPIAFGIAIYPEDIYKMYDYIIVTTNYGLLAILAYPFIALIIAKIRGKRGQAA
ncbi:GerAB/ArcD/ProY family transporter [Gracilibacillus sp. HCP3S3_G5_1]|uniref:GerAB/ArcD/ProY family transporter n=1 Tax=unclassified Gracilibacillus TaxID=2625209 RepID=UPI003F89DAEF